MAMEKLRTAEREGKFHHLNIPRVPEEDGGMTPDPPCMDANFRMDGGLKREKFDLTVKFRKGRTTAEAYMIAQDELTDEEKQPENAETAIAEAEGAMSRDTDQREVTVAAAELAEAYTQVPRGNEGTTTAAEVGEVVMEVIAEDNANVDEITGNRDEGPPIAAKPVVVVNKIATMAALI